MNWGVCVIILDFPQYQIIFIGTLTKPEYPYCNTDLEPLKGECWKDIPGLNGYFVISNYGRVKRRTYEMRDRNGFTYIKPEKIIRPTLVKYFNKSKGDKSVFLASKVTLSKKAHNFTVARLVYYCFVEPIDLAGDSTQIVAMDGDNLNIRPDNLRAVSRSQRVQRTIDRKTSHSPFHDVEDSAQAEMQKKLVRTYEKQVSQYDVTGKRIATFDRMADAQRATGISYVCIASVARGNHIRAGGYFWRWGKESKIDVAAFLAARRTEKRLNHGLKVTQYTLTGKRIAQYPSVEDAEKETGTHGSAIRQVMHGKLKSTKGSFWKEGYGPDQIDLTGYKWGGASAAAKLSKQVAQYSLSGEYIRTFESIKGAAAAVKAPPQSLSEASRGLRPTCAGWVWKVIG
jgi:hypothetical protein